MELTNKGKVYLLFAVLSALFSYLTITLYYFPHFGMSFSLITFTVVLYSFKKDKGKETNIYFALTLLFALFIFVRSQPLITFFNVVFTILFGSLMTLSSQKAEKMSLWNIAVSPFHLLSRSLFTKSNYYPDSSAKKSKQLFNVTEIAGGAIITVLLLIVIIPLLGSTNPFFQKLIDNVGQLTWLRNLFTNLNPEVVFVWSLRSVFFFTFLFFIPKMATFVKDATLPLKEPFKNFSFPLLIPKTVTVLVLLIYLITQLQLYFASKETLVELGLTYSQYTREVFAQLLVVSVIVLALIYNNRKREGIHKTLTYILVVQGMFLGLMAFKSVYEYSAAFGFTQKRLWGFTVVAWSLGVFILFLRNYYYKLSNSTFIKQTTIFTGIMLILVNLLNFEYLIYNVRKSTTGQGVDYEYLSTLSKDSLSYSKQYNRLMERVQNEPHNITHIENNIAWRLLSNIDYLQNKYNNLDIRTFSLFDYIQYRQIKNVDINEYGQLTGQSLPPQRFTGPPPN